MEPRRKRHVGQSGKFLYFTVWDISIFVKYICQT